MWMWMRRKQEEGREEGEKGVNSTTLPDALFSPFLESISKP
jgi:hypothetical protein